MIGSLRGKLIHKEDGLAVVECAGVGYACRASYATLSQIEIGKEVFLYTYMSVREDSATLFGFVKKQELNCFKELISVSGVGGKAALSILSSLSPEQFALTVATGDYKSLTKIKGIGNKGAQKIVFELKDKIGKEVSSAPGAEMISAANAPAEGNIGEAAAALVVLGYSQAEALSAVAKLDSTLPAEELIKQALKSMALSR